MRSARRTGHIPAAAANNTFSVAGGRVFFLRITTVLSMADQQPLVRRIHSQLPRRPRHTAAAENYFNLAAVAHHRLFRDFFRAGLVAETAAVRHSHRGDHSSVGDENLSAGAASRMKAITTKHWRAIFASSIRVPHEVEIDLLYRDPLFSGLATSLMFGTITSTVLTLLVLPPLYYRMAQSHPEWAYKRK